MPSLNLWSLSLVMVWHPEKCLGLSSLHLPPNSCSCTLDPPLTPVNPPQTLPPLFVCPVPPGLAILVALHCTHIALELGNPKLAMAASPVPGRGKHLPRCAGRGPPGMAQNIVCSILHKEQIAGTRWT